MAVVSCPECTKKLKVADTSVGKKVKCTCGKIFVVEAPGDVPAPKQVAVAAAPPPAVITPEKVFVSCSECSAKLKVATTSLGKRMKCPKCAAVFVANLPEEAAPVKKAVQAVAPPADLDEEEAPKPKPKAKAPPAKADDEMDALFGFAQEDAKAGDSDAGLDKDLNDDDANFDDDEMVTPAPRGKAAKAKAPPSRRHADDDDDDDEELLSPPEEETKPVYPSRLLVNIFVLLMILAWGVFFSLVFLDIVKLADLGLGRSKREPAVIDPKTKVQAPIAPQTVPVMTKQAVKKNGRKIDVKSIEPKKIDNERKIDEKKVDDNKKDDQTRLDDRARIGSEHAMGESDGHAIPSCALARHSRRLRSGLV